MPTTRALVFSGVLKGRLQQRFRSSPGDFGLTRLKHGCFWDDKRARCALTGLAGQRPHSRTCASAERAVSSVPHRSDSAERAWPAGC